MSDLNRQESDFSRLIHKSPFDDAVRPEHRENLHQQVLREFDRSLATTKPIRSRNQLFHSWRQFMRRPLPRFIAISMVCLAIIALWLALPSQQMKAFAFNNLAAAIIEAKTAKFKMEATMEGMPKQTIQAYYLAPGKYRLENSFGPGSIAITDNTTGKQLMLLNSTKTAIVATSKGKPEGRPSNDPFELLRDLLSKNRDEKSNSFKPIGEKAIAGKQAKGFQSETASGKHTIWGDPATGQPLLVEWSWGDSKRGSTVMSDFEMNVALDEKLFDMTPPKDYKIQSLEVDVSPASEQNFIDALKYYGEINGGELPNSLSFLETMSTLEKLGKARLGDKREDTDEKMKLAKELAPVVRGFSFAIELPDSADAHYAGKDIKQGTPDRPIFWYKPKGATKYRVIYADRSVKDSDAAPQIDGAIRLIKTDAATNPDGKKD